MFKNNSINFKLKNLQITVEYFTDEILDTNILSYFSHDELYLLLSKYIISPYSIYETLNLVNYYYNAPDSELNNFFNRSKLELINSKINTFNKDPKNKYYIKYTNINSCLIEHDGFGIIKVNNEFAGIIGFDEDDKNILKDKNYNKNIIDRCSNTILSMCYFLHSKYHNNKIMSEVINRTLQNINNNNTILISTDINNIPSCKIIKKYCSNINYLYSSNLEPILDKYNLINKINSKNYCLKDTKYYNEDNDILFYIYQNKISLQLIGIIIK